MQNDLYGFERILEREISKLENSAVSKRNKKIIMDFHRYNLMRDLSNARMIKHLSTLRIVALKTQKDFDKVKTKDYEELLLGLKRSDLSHETICTYKRVLKVFHKWLDGKDEYPECVKWFKSTRTKSKKLPEQMLTQEEVKKLLKNTSSPRDKALISVLWESGARISEIGTLKIKHVSFDKHGCKILVNGKTGRRRVRLINSAPDLMEWLNKHPTNNDLECPVWVNVKFNRLQQMGHRYIMKLISTTAKRAGIKKPVNPHNFRHSRATYMAQFLTEAQLKEYFGWTPSSDMAAQYVHLSGKQVDNAILRMHGIIKEDRKEDILKRNECPRCKEQNDVNNSYCSKCWLPLTQEAAFEAEEKQRKEDTGIIALMKLLKKYKDNPDRLLETLSVIEAGVTK
ncbi:MAG: tyrosine-type recombinase/integrase [Candidatus Diapherotrites archaeon]